MNSNSFRNRGNIAVLSSLVFFAAYGITWYLKQPIKALLGLGLALVVAGGIAIVSADAADEKAAQKATGQKGESGDPHTTG